MNGWIQQYNHKLRKRIVLKILSLINHIQGEKFSHKQEKLHKT